MRDHNEIKAEIFRRSREKIKRRRQFGNLMFIAVLVCVCMIILPFFLTKDNGKHTVEIPTPSIQSQNPTTEFTNQTHTTPDGKIPPANSNKIYATLNFNGNRVAVCTNEQQADILQNSIEIIKNNYTQSHYEHSNEGGRMGVYVVSIGQPNRKYGIDIGDKLFIDFYNGVSYSVENISLLQEMLKIFNIE